MMLGRVKKYEKGLIFQDFTLWISSYSPGIEIGLNSSVKSGARFKSHSSGCLNFNAIHNS